MAKLDEVKEILNTLRLFFSICIGLIVVLTGSLISKEEKGDIDLYFWIGSSIDLILMIGLVFIIKSIKKNTKEIKDL
jgi:nitrogen fixation/metabolism regulation signal transduction histidine kinase